MTVTPFLVKEDRYGSILVVVGFTDGPSPKAITVGTGVCLLDLDRLEVVRAARDWPRPDGDNPETEAIYGPRMNGIGPFTTFID